MTSAGDVLRRRCVDQSQGFDLLLVPLYLVKLLHRGTPLSSISDYARLLLEHGCTLLFAAYSVYGARLNIRAE